MEKYIVKLSEEERENLLSLIKKGKAAAHKLTHARILLGADESDPTRKKTDSEIAEQLHVGLKTIQRVRKKFVEEDLAVALERKKNKNKRLQKINGEVEAHLIATCCSSPPEGRTRWTLKLLSNRLIEMQVIDNISSATVGRALKKTNLSRGKKKNGAFRQKQMQNLSVIWKTS